MWSAWRIRKQAVDPLLESSVNWGMPAAPVLVASAIDAERPISWVTAKCLSDAASVWFLQELCYRRSITEQDFIPRLKLSSNCAAGPTVEAATLRALLELIERDVVARRPARTIAADSEAGAAASELLAELRQGKVERKTWLLDFTTDIEIPAVVALSTRAEGFGLLVWSWRTIDSCGGCARGHFRALPG